MKRFGSPVVPVLVALALVVAGCAASTTSPSEAPTQAASAAASTASTASAPASASAAPETEEETVRLSGFAFEPTELTIAAGTEVAFVNADSTAHTVTEGTDGTAVDDPIVDEELAQNASTRVTFDEPGTYEITCRIHPAMQMTITVEG